MNEEFIILRMLHIIFGVFWAGSSIFFATILDPRLKAIGPAVHGPVIKAIMPITSRVMLVSATITIAAGTALALRLRWGQMDTFLDTGWGWAIMIGFMASMVAYVLGMATSGTSKRMIKLAASTDVLLQEANGDLRVQHMQSRLIFYGRANAILVTIAVGTMAVARFV